MKMMVLTILDTVKVLWSCQKISSKKIKALKYFISSLRSVWKSHVFLMKCFLVLNNYTATASGNLVTMYKNIVAI